MVAVEINIDVFEDINECEDDVCSQECINTAGGYSCSCLPGYSSENNSCVVSRGRVSLVYNHQADIMLLDAVSQQSVSLVKSAYTGPLVTMMNKHSL